MRKRPELQIALRIIHDLIYRPRPVDLARGFDDILHLARGKVNMCRTEASQLHFRACVKVHVRLTIQRVSVDSDIAIKRSVITERKNGGRAK